MAVPTRTSRIVVAVVATTAIGLTASVPAIAQIRPAPRSTDSDPRATLVEQNLTTCAQIGLPDAVQTGAQGTNPPAVPDSNVVGTVVPNSGDIQPGVGEELQVEITDAGEALGVEVLAVVVKGGDSSNVYSDGAVLPPALNPPDQHYISPINGGGNVPDISHWFVCYDFQDPTPPDDSGALTVLKSVLHPPGIPVEALPTEFTVVVDCDGLDPVTVTFGAAGGLGTPTPAIPDGPPGTVCTVEEQGTEGFPEGSTVLYLTADGPSETPPEVTLEADQTVRVAVTNDFRDVDVQTGSIQVVKEVLPGVPLPDTLTVELLCRTPNADMLPLFEVTVPGTGGEGTPLVEVPVGSFCALVKPPGQLPDGTVATYSIDGGPPLTADPIVVVGPVVAGETIAVTVTNDAPDVLPETGADGVPSPLRIAAALVLIGALASIGASRVRRSATSMTG